MRPLHVVVVGGGVAAIETCLALRALAGTRVQLTIVSPERWYESKPAAVGELFGVAPTQRRFRVQGVLVFEFRDGKIAVERRLYDFTSLLVQVGVLKTKPGK